MVFLPATFCHTAPANKFYALVAVPLYMTNLDCGLSAQPRHVSLVCGGNQDKLENYFFGLRVVPTKLCTESAGDELRGCGAYSYNSMQEASALTPCNLIRRVEQINVLQFTFTYRNRNRASCKRQSPELLQRREQRIRKAKQSILVTVSQPMA